MSATQDERPTFGTYWRSNRSNTDDSRAKSLVFVQSDPGKSKNKASEKTEELEHSAKQKRQAQVRKAQIQHRARKANYTKQLEADIAAIRKHIDDVDRDRRKLRTENRAMRARLSEPQQQIGANHCQYNRNQGSHATATFNPRDSTMSYGFGVDSAGLAYLDVEGPSLYDMLGAPGGYGGYFEDGSPWHENSFKGSLGAHGSPQYIGSGSNTPCSSLSEIYSLNQSRQRIDYTTGFP
ncbi:hypothetical protein N0V93_001383 [Gnomoniopsis smithogilvyi]|uniref:BZIP domain-containing protein n=1 Tax=Gnomoniopsis smithogilvyi TaxID=1191159 RepID=A0A9W9D261_9PEZI|nr:hypothetical protein N0V93_001383 [Gnomoniopsis smithogilvyi]